MRKPSFGVFNQFRPEPAWPSSETNKRLEITDIYKLEVLKLYISKQLNKGADQIVWMCRLICTFAVCYMLKTGFLRGSSNGTV